MSTYFCLQKLPQDQLTIQDQTIDLSHPRNVLNILLYLNQHFNLSMTKLFEVYCTELIRNKCSEIVIKMIKEQQTFQICQVRKDILEEIVQNVIIQKIKQCITNIQWIGKTLELFDCNLSPNSIKKKKQLTIILNVIDTLNLIDLFFSVDTLFQLPYVKNLFVFCNSLIRQNSSKNLQKIKLQELYKDLHTVTYGSNVKYYNQQLKDLLEILCQKFFQNGQLQKAFQVISPIVMVTKRGFIAKMLYKYLNGKLMNRLSNKYFTTKQQFKSAFYQFFASSSRESNQKELTCQTIQRDLFKFSSIVSYLKDCSYLKFLPMFRKTISVDSEQITFICYTDYQLASQLSTYHIISKEQWRQFNEVFKDYILKEQTKKLVDKNMFKFNSRIKITQQDYDQQNQLLPSTSLIMKDSGLLNPQPTRKTNENLIIKSLQAIEFEEQNKRELKTHKITVHRSKSDPHATEEDKQQNRIDPLIQSLKYQVNPQVIKQTLKQIYQSKQQINEEGGRIKKFMNALSMVDRQRLGFCHYEKFKSMINLQLKMRVQKLIPFEIFFITDYDLCFDKIKESYLNRELSLKNFWPIYIILQMLLTKGEDTVVLMIQRLMITVNSSDNLRQIIDKILNGTKLSLKCLKILIQKSQKLGLTQISTCIRSRIPQQSIQNRQFN